MSRHFQHLRSRDSLAPKIRWCVYRGVGKIVLFWTDLVVPAERMCKGCADDVRKGCAGDAWKGCAKGCAGFSGAYFWVLLAIVLIYKKQFVLWNVGKRYLPAPNNSKLLRASFKKLMSDRHKKWQSSAGIPQKSIPVCFRKRQTVAGILQKVDIWSTQDMTNTWLPACLNISMPDRPKQRRTFACLPGWICI